jgi:hypothetical protein
VATGRRHQIVQWRVARGSMSAPRSIWSMRRPIPAPAAAARRQSTAACRRRARTCRPGPHRRGSRCRHAAPRGGALQHVGPGARSRRQIPVRSIAEKIGLRTSANAPPVTRSVRSDGSTPIRQDAPIEAARTAEGLVQMVESVAVIVLDATAIGREPGSPVGQTLVRPVHPPAAQATSVAGAMDLSSWYRW